MEKIMQDVLQILEDVEPTKDITFDDIKAMKERFERQDIPHLDWQYSQLESFKAEIKKQFENRSYSDWWMIYFQLK